jgi:lysophospholipase L1-like esterase
VSTTTRQLLVQFPTNNRTEHIQVRTFFDGLWSAWKSHRVAVAYTAPAVPIVDLTVGSSYITVNVSNPPKSGTQPTVTSWDVYRSVTGSESAAIRVAAGVSADWIDYAIASGVDYSYRALAIATTGATTYSAWEPAAGVYLRQWSNLAAAGIFDPSIACSAGYPTPVWTVTHPDGTVETSNALTPSFTISGTGYTSCELGPVSLYPYITKLDANGDGLVGTWTARELALLPALEEIHMYTNTSWGLVCTTAELPATLRKMYLDNTSYSVISGPIGALPVGMTHIGVMNSACSMSGPLADFPAGVVYVSASNSALNISGGVSPIACVAVATIDLGASQPTGMTQANVDDLLLRLYTDRASLTAATLTVTITGSTPAPSGVFQNATPPTTGLEYAYKLVFNPHNDHTTKVVVDPVPALFTFADQFTTIRAAGAVNGTAAEPGTDTRTVVDAESKLTINSGRLQIAGGKAAASFSDPAMWYGARERVPGLAFGARVLSRAANTIFGLGFDDNASGSAATAGIVLNNNGTVVGREAGTTSIRNLWGYSAGAEYDFLVVLRTAGCFLLWRAVGATNYDLLWVGAADTAATVYPNMWSYNMAGYVDNVLTGQLLDAEWSTPYGLATDTTLAPATGATMTHTADGWVEFTWTPGANEVVDISVRQIDADNRWIVRCDQANGWIRIYDRITGAETQRATAAQTWTVGTTYRIAVTMRDTRLAVYVGTTYKATYSSAFQQTATICSVSGFATGATFVSWPAVVTVLPWTWESDKATLSFGDSKVYANTMEPVLAANLSSADADHTWRVAALGRAGWTAAMWAGQIDTDLATLSDIPEFVVVNLGTNDVEPNAAPLVEATWEADYAYILDAIHTKWPNAKVYCARTWRRYNNGDQTAMDDTWIPAVLSTRSTWADVGIDERVILEGGDNGVTYTSDGIHPNAAGYALMAAGWQSVMGY